MTELERKYGMSQEDINSQIQANKQRIDEGLLKLHNSRAYVDQLTQEANERYRAFMEKHG